MLIWAQGTCESCATTFRRPDLIQSVEVECTKCGRRRALCGDCQAAGCPDCGGRLLNAWQRVDRDLPGHGVMF